MMTAWRTIFFFAFLAQTATDCLPPGRGNARWGFFQFINIRSLIGGYNIRRRLTLTEGFDTPDLIEAKELLNALK